MDRSSQTTIGFTPNSLGSYRAVSSRDEQVIYGGSGLKLELSQESSSYPTPPEMKSMDLDAVGDDVKIQEPSLSELKLEPMEMGIPSVVSPIEISRSKRAAVISPHLMDIPRAISPVDLFSPTLPVETVSSVTVPQPELPAKMYFSSDFSSDFPLQNNDNQISPAGIQSPSNAQHDSPFQRPKLPPIKDEAAAHNAALLQTNPSLRSSTVLNPDFLRSYFDQSRLHHLSTWKADLKTQMQHLASQTPSGPKNPNTERRIMHVDFDCFFCSVSLLAQPDLKDKPVCVGHGGGRSGEIASCNYPARKFGIHNGMLYVPLQMKGC